MIHAIRGLLPASLILFWFGGAHAATLYFPGPAPCNASLQACIDGAAAGDTIWVDSNGPFPGLSFSKSLHLRAFPGRQPSLNTDASIEATLPAGGPNYLSIEGFTLVKGRIAVLDESTADAFVTLRRNRLLFQLAGIQARPYLQILSAGNASVLHVDVSENLIETGTGAAKAESIRILPQKRLSGQVAFNRVQSSGHRTSSAIQVHGRRASNSNSIGIYGNEVSGRFEGGAIVAQFSSLQAAVGATSRADLYSNVVHCGTAATGFGRGLLVQNVDNNAISVYNVFNNTVIECDAPLLATAPAGATIAGGLVNNLVAYNSVSIQTGGGAVGQFTIDRNLSHGNSVNSVPAGASNTITAAPRLYARSAPRLRANSPAIGAGNSAWAHARLNEAGRPRLDGDGGRRFIGGDGIDIGAFEYGDRHLSAVKQGSSGAHLMYIDHPSLNGGTTLRPLATPAPIAGIVNPHPIGFWYNVGQWSLFNQNIQTMPQGARFNVLVPGAESHGGAVYAHIAVPATISLFQTDLSHPFLNSHNDDQAVVLVTPNWNQPGSEVYNAHYIGVGPCTISPAEPGCWALFNLSLANMPANASFNVYAQERSPSAFVHQATGNNIVSGLVTVIDHPQLNGNDCVQLQITPRLGSGAGAVNDRHTYVYYDFGRWRIANSGGQMDPGASWYVLFSGRQAFECQDRIFADGF